jgi:hypothetical protein
MKQMQRVQLGGLFLIVFMVSIFLSPSAALAEDVNLIRNGNFSDGLPEWVIDPETGAGWNPLADGAVNLHPPTTTGYMGTVIYQNLNVTGIGGATVTFQARLTAATTPSEGNTVAFYLTFVDTGNIVSRVKVFSPDNTAIPQDPNDQGSVFTTSYLFPAQARKLVKIEVAKEDYGDFVLDDVSLITGDEVSMEALPTISSLSSLSGAYASSLTISGANFGSIPPVVKIGESSDGVVVTSVSDTSLVVTIQDPARSGRVCVITDYSESNINHLFEITSPNYTVDVLEETIMAVKGQIVEFVFRLDFLNGFTTQNGVNFILQGLPQGTFLPIPVKNTGGVLLKIDTTSLDAGIYPFVVQASDGSAATRLTSGFLEVVTITDIRFSESVEDSNSGTWSTIYLTSKTVTSQGSFFLTVDAIDSNGNVWTTWDNSPLHLSSSNPGVVSVYDRVFGPEIYALQTGFASLVAITADGYQEFLPLEVSITSPQVTSISLSPSTVYNTSTDSITFEAQADDALGWTGNDSVGMMTFETDFLDKLHYSTDSQSSTSTFNLLNSPTDLGMVLFNTSTGTNSRVAPLFIVNDPNLTELAGGIRLMDNVFAEMFTLEFYDPDDESTLLFTREMFMMHGEKNFHLGGIEPGTYKLRILAEGDAVIPQWYPNADSFSTAFPVTLTPGLVDNIYFFIKGYPTISFTGSVRDGVDNYPDLGIENATVQVVENGNIWKLTDTSGDFKLSGIRADQDFEINITQAGFTPVYSEIFNGAQNLQGLLPYALVPSEMLATWGNATGTGVVIGRAIQWDNPAVYLDGVSLIAVNQADNTQEFPVTYEDPATKIFGGSSTYENGVFAVFNVPVGVTVTLTAVKSGWTFARPTSWVTVRADALCEASFLGMPVDEPAIRNSFESAMTAITAGDISGFMSFVSADYLDDGINRDQFEVEIDGIIQASESMAYEIQSIVLNGDQAVMNIVWNGLDSDTLYFQKEGTDWMLYGNQNKYEVSVHSGHTSTSYWVGMTVDDPNNTITAVSVAGPGIDTVINLFHDIGENRWSSWQVDSPYDSVGPEFGTNPETPPLTYTFTITDGQGATSVTVEMNSFVEVFAVPVYPAVNQTVVTPTSFSWTLAGSGYSYGVELNDANGTRVWNVYDITGTSVVYTGQPLVPGSFYYNLNVQDNDGNFSMVTVPFSVTPSKGDLDADGSLTPADAILGMKVLTGLTSAGITITGDEKVGMEDVMYILQDAGGAR